MEFSASAMEFSAFVVKLIFKGLFLLFGWWSLAILGTAGCALVLIGWFIGDGGGGAGSGGGNAPETAEAVVTVTSLGAAAVEGVTPDDGGSDTHGSETGSEGGVAAADGPDAADPGWFEIL
jgi:hypothetical protein